MAERVFIPFVGTDPAKREFRTGQESKTYSRAFLARWGGVCDRCGHRYEEGDCIKYHNDYSNVVHDNCTDKDAVRVSDGVKVTGARKPPLCTDCWLEHNGECP